MGLFDREGSQAVTKIPSSFQPALTKVSFSLRAPLGPAGGPTGREGTVEAQGGAVQVVASLMCADLTALGAAVRALEAAGVDGFHVDIMDGVFVPNIVLGPPVVAALRPLTTRPFEAHLMVRDPRPLLPALAEAGCELCLVHAEARGPLRRAVEAVRAAGMAAGVALNPETPPGLVEPVLDLVSRVLVMTVRPGFAGRPMVPGAARRVAAVAALLRRTGSAALVEVDGNVNPRTVGPLVAAGARVLVGGSTGLFLPDQPLAVSLARLRAAAARALAGG